MLVRPKSWRWHRKIPLTMTKQADPHLNRTEDAAVVPNEKARQESGPVRIHLTHVSALLAEP